MRPRHHRHAARQAIFPQRHTEAARDVVERDVFLAADGGGREHSRAFTRQHAQPAGLPLRRGFRRDSTREEGERGDERNGRATQNLYMIMSFSNSCWTAFV